MLFSDLERKVRRLFGDEFDIIIEKQDIIDWTNAAQVDIARKTYCLPTDVIQPASAFPYIVADMYLMYRVTYGNPAQPKSFTTLEDIDAKTIPYGLAPVGTPDSYYLRGKKVYLYPTPSPTDTTNVTITYDRAPVDLVLNGNLLLDIPSIYHEDVVRYVLARAHEKNENYEGQNMSDTYYNDGLAQRIHESTHGDEGFPFVRNDVMDFQ